MPNCDANHYGISTLYSLRNKEPSIQQAIFMLIAIFALFRFLQLSFCSDSNEELMLVLLYYFSCGNLCVIDR